MATTYNGAFEHELGKLIDEVIEQLVMQAAGGTGIVDYPAYRQLVGHVAGLRQAKELFEEANDILNR